MLGEELGPVVVAVLILELTTEFVFTAAPEDEEGMAVCLTVMVVPDGI